MMRAVLVVLALAGCARPVPPVAAGAPLAGAPTLDTLATAGVQDPALAALLDRHWRWRLARHPEEATWLGLPGHDHAVTDPSAAAADAARDTQASMLADAERVAASLSPGPDRRVVQRLIASLRDGIAERACRSEAWVLSIRDNPLSDLWALLDLQPLDTDAARAAAAQRIEAAAEALDARVVALGEGVAAGRVPNRRSVEVVLAQVRGVLDADTEAWAPAVRAGVAGDDGRILAALDTRWRPALERFAAFLDATLLPAARPDTAAGLAALPGVDACYAARVGRYTTDPSLDAASLHATGLAELARIHDRMRTVGATAFGTSDLAAILDRLRTDPALRFDSAEAIVAAAEDALRRAETAVPAVIGRLPRTPCGVSPVPEHEAPFTTIAYYEPPAQDGSRPGTYVVNTYQPATRTRFEAEALAFHEAVPGHHTQIALAQERSTRPAIERFDGATVFVEGWALYAEGLAEELGLYSGPLDVLGRLSFEAWRASRLVVDTGLHDLGWSRDQAIAFLRDNTALAEDNVVNEVDRYIAWPGQALAYKTGEIALRALRAEAEAALGERFDLRAFHDVVLGQGAPRLPALRETVRAWVAEGGPPVGFATYDDEPAVDAAPQNR